MAAGQLVKPSMLLKAAPLKGDWRASTDKVVWKLCLQEYGSATRTL